MTERIITYSTIIVVTLICILFNVRMYKKSQTIVERSAYLVLLFIYIVIATFYILDRNDIPTRLGYLKNINPERWFSFLSTFISELIGVVISGVILVLITVKQMKTQIDNNKEDKRIQNAPILKYDISNEKVEDANQIYMINDDGDVYNLYLNIENVGLNHARHLKIEIHEESTKLLRTFDIDGKQSILKQNEKIFLDLIFSFKYNKKNNESNRKKIKIDVYYEDLLKNKYKQSLNLFLTTTDEASSRYGGYKFEINKIDISDEEYQKNKE